MCSETINRLALIEDLLKIENEAFTPCQSIDGPYDPRVLSLTKRHGLRASDGRIRSVSEEIAHQRAALALAKAGA